MITQEYLKSILIYNGETGEFTWKETRNPQAIKGNIAGSVNDAGYITIRLSGSHYRAHRLAWLYVYGVEPSGVLDHRDRNKSNNRLDNLRDTNQMVNGLNRGLNKNNSSGYKGVYKDKNRWNAKFIYMEVPFNLGNFDTPEQANEALEDFRAEYNLCEY